MKEIKVENLKWVSAWIWLLCLQVLAGSLFISNAIDRNTEAVKGIKIETVKVINHNDKKIPHCAFAIDENAPCYERDGEVIYPHGLK